MSLTDNLITFKNRADVAMEQLVSTNALKLQNYMRENYKWTPRSGRAHQTMTGSYEKQQDGFLIKLSYGVDYGIFLELAHEKKYALTKPTAKEKGPEVMQSFNRLIDGLEKRTHI